MAGCCLVARSKRPSPLCGSAGCPVDSTLLPIVSVPTPVPGGHHPGLPTLTSLLISTAFKSRLILSLKVEFLHPGSKLRVGDQRVGS